jgi:hypothetical protein
MNLKSAMKAAVEKELGGGKKQGASKANPAAVAAIKALKAAKSEEQEAEAYRLLIDSFKED